MHNLEPILREHPFFRDLEPRFIELLVGCASNVLFKPGEHIYIEGGPADHFYLIREGCVVQEAFVPARGSIPIQTVGAGDVLGWSWLFPPYKHHYAARAQDRVRAIVFDGACLRGKCETDHDLGYELYKRFSRIVVESLEATRLQLLDVYGSVPA